MTRFDPTEFGRLLARLTPQELGQAEGMVAGARERAEALLEIDAHAEEGGPPNTRYQSSLSASVASFGAKESSPLEIIVACDRAIRCALSERPVWAERRFTLLAIVLNHRSAEPVDRLARGAVCVSRLTAFGKSVNYERNAVL